MEHFLVLGARGSYPVYGERYRRYGGSTTCFSLETDQGILLVDAGTGLTGLGDALVQRQTLPPITLLFTHMHLDHIAGLPAFKPLLRKDARVTIVADQAVLGDWHKTLTTVISQPVWPVNLSDFGAALAFEEFPRGALSRYGLTITRCAVSHPQGCLSYRIQTRTRSIVIATDREHGDAELDKKFTDFCQGADVLIHDAQYTPDELAARTGWGHSTWEASARTAVKCGVKRLVLVSHDPSRSDEQVDAVLTLARQVFPATAAGAENTTLEALFEPPKPADTASAVAAPAPVDENGPVKFRYQFTFRSGDVKTFEARLAAGTMQLEQPARTDWPDWTRLSNNKCSNCPLNEAESPHCPAATSMADTIEYFAQSNSIEQVDVRIDAGERQYVKRCALPEAVSSLIGIYMTTSGCPVMAKFRPMVRFHLPFATLEETRYRVLSMYLLAQYLRAKRGASAEWDGKGIGPLVEEIRTVNDYFSKRLRTTNIEDATLNAIVRLDAFADVIAFTVDQHMLETLEPLFRAYLPGQAP